jgi:16S rRNA G527 N7-methylase RsmG
MTKGALLNLFSKIQRCTELLFTEKHLNNLPFPKEDYNLKENSTFLDIGSGFGKPVFHASL